MSGPSAYQASPVRVSLALLVAYVLPVSLMGVANTGFEGGPLPGPLRLTGGVLLGIYAGWIFAWPYLLGSAAAWAVLHHFRRDTRLAAVLIGLACGVICGLTLRPGFVFLPLVIRLLTVAGMALLGAATGWIVWRIAYRRVGDSPSFF